MVLDTPQAMGQYINAVMARAKHHGGNVTDAIATLSLFVWEYGTDIQISDRKNGKIGNVSWFKSKASGRGYYFRYEHANGGSIAMLRNNCNGSLVARFTNQTTASLFVSVFETA